jgi:polyferredoxin
MDIVIDTFRNRPGKTLSSFFVAILGIVTILMFQDLKVETLGDLFSYLTNSQENSTLLLTWGFNLFTFIFLVILGVLWIKDVIKENYMDISPGIGKLTSLIVGILHLAFSILFLSYIFSKLLGIVIAVLIFFAIVYNEKPKRRHY